MIKYIITFKDGGELLTRAENLRDLLLDEDGEQKYLRGYDLEDIESINEL